MFIKKVKEGLTYLEFERLKQYGFEVIFTTRLGGFSIPPYESLNLGLHTDDKKENVLKNREKVYDILNFNPKNIIYAEQIHSNDIRLVTTDDKGKGIRDHNNSIKNMDGLIATKKDMILGGHFADCVPIYIMDKDKGYFSLIHSGWKGTYQEILTKTLNFFKDSLASKDEDLLVVLGPSISKNNYEVGFDLINKFKEKFAFPPSYFEQIDNNYFLDLKELNRLIALENGILNKNLFVSKLCTYKNKNLFYSYRRDQGKTGRMAAFISLLS